MADLSSKLENDVKRTFTQDINALEKILSYLEAQFRVAAIELLTRIHGIELVENRIKQFKSTGLRLVTLRLIHK